MKRKMLILSMLLLMVGAGSGSYFSDTNIQYIALQQQVQQSISQGKNASVTSPVLRSVGSSLDALVAYLATLLGGMVVVSFFTIPHIYSFFRYSYTSVQLTPEKEKARRWGWDDIL